MIVTRSLKQILESLPIREVTMVAISRVFASTIFLRRAAGKRPIRNDLLGISKYSFLTGAGWYLISFLFIVHNDSVIPII